MHIFRPVTCMQMTRLCLAVGTLSGIAALGLGGQAAWADPCTTPNNGPTGSAAATFTYQCTGTYAGDWTNKYYAYSPTTGTQTALYAPDYSYDCTTGTWTQAEWDYDAGSGAYIESRVAAIAPPDTPTNCPAPTSSSGTTPNSSSQTSASAQTTTPDPTPPTTPATPTSTSSTTQATPTPAQAYTEPSSNTTANPVATDPHAPTGPVKGTSLTNTVGSQSQTGNAAVTNNGTAGNATSGNATTTVDVANLVETVGNAFGSGTTTFTSNIDGNVNGDLVFDPSVIAAGASGSDNPDSEPTTLLSSTNGNTAIDNDITASADTGNATVAGNGTAGNATSGNAETAVNLINIINSAVAAGHSFVGTININGDLNGNILIPQSVIDELLSTNAAGTDTDPTANTAVASTSNESISNNVTASAISGDATVANNQNAGNATSGAAGTNVTIMNLTGSSIVGKNVLLVFVNVLGQWVGMIVNAPTGATSAEFGDGIESTTTPTTTAPTNSAIEANAQLSITNNVDASARSGNALVTDNGTAGDATSGTAETAVNILNVENSVLSLANWFGVLFINVFGTWNGNFGIEPTPTPIAPSSISTNNPAQTTNDDPASYSVPSRFATFVANNNTSDSSPASSPNTSGDTAVLGDAIITPAASKSNTNSQATSDAAHISYAVPAFGLGITLLLLVASERDRILRRKS